MATDLTGAAPQSLEAPLSMPAEQVLEGPLCPNRGAAVSMGFFSGWFAASICEVGIIPALLAGFGVSSGFVGSQILGGLGWYPVVGIFSVALMLGFAYLQTRRYFGTAPRPIAMRAFWSTSRTMFFSAGIAFFGWTLLMMTVVYAIGGGAMKM